MNRISERLSLEPFTTIDTDDRYAVQEEVANYINEVYAQGINHPTFSHMTYKKTTNYPTNRENRLKDIDEKLGHIYQNTANDTDFTKS